MLRDTFGSLNEVYGIFEGGGVRGTALVGALSVIEEQNITFRGVAGTSAGAIVASLLAAGYSAKEMLNMMLDKSFLDFKDPVSRIPVFRHLIAWQKNGLYKGDEFFRWIEEKLIVAAGSRNKSPRFKDLSIPLTIIAADIFRKEMIVFSKSNYPDLRVADAVRMSMSIPGFFCPVQFGESLVVDGGIVSNFPVLACQEYQKVHHLPILGLRLKQDDQLQPRKIRGMVNLGIRVVNTAIQNNTELQMATVQDLYTIDLPTLGVGVTDFGILNHQKQKLYEAGRLQTQLYFASLKDYSKKSSWFNFQF